VANAKTTTKKILVAFDPSHPDAGRGDFLAPVSGDERIFFVGLRSRSPSDLGLLVYVGKEVPVNDLFAKLVDSGRKIASVDQTVKMLSEYLTMLQEFKIGNVMSIEPDAAEPNAFRLVKIANTPSGATKE
jgi:hypothetical protein